jgi:hypothetical protein
MMILKSPCSFSAAIGELLRDNLGDPVDGANSYIVELNRISEAAGRLLTVSVSRCIVTGLRKYNIFIQDCRS